MKNRHADVDYAIMNALDIAVFVPAGPGALSLVGSRPQWLAALPDGNIQIDEAFPFLTGFLVAAESFGKHGDTGCLRSDIWEQAPFMDDSEGETYAFRAAALTAGNRRLLLIERLEEEYEEYRAALQRFSRQEPRQ